MSSYDVASNICQAVADGVLAVTGDSRLLFYGAGGAAASDAGNITIERELIGNTDEIISAAFLPMPDAAAAAAAATGADGVIKAGATPVSALAVATNSALLRVFDPSTMACTAALGGHTGAILSLAGAYYFFPFYSLT
jgi:U3 small nucleolar RNA-associated protein 13